MRYIFSTMMLILFFSGTTGLAQETPSELLRSTLDSVSAELLDKSPQIDRIYPVVSSELPEAKTQPILDLWRRSLNAAGREVFLTSQPGTNRAELRVETYAFNVHSEKSGWFGKQTLSGILNLKGDVLIADTSGKVIETIPVDISKMFQMIENKDIWYAEKSRQHYPIQFTDLQDRPEVRTILLAVTSAVIIYLFYSIRG